VATTAVVCVLLRAWVCEVACFAGALAQVGAGVAGGWVESFPHLISAGRRFMATASFNLQLQQKPLSLSLLQPSPLFVEWCRGVMSFIFYKFMTNWPSNFSAVWKSKKPDTNFVDKMLKFFLVF